MASSSSRLVDPHVSPGQSTNYSHSLESTSQSHRPEIPAIDTQNLTSPDDDGDEMPDAATWKQRSIYQILTDRFAIGGAGDNGPQLDYLSRQYCGGNWQGIIEKLDYIQGMGFDAIWISPVTKNIENNTHYGAAYHGYWQEDLYSVNPHFGTAEDLMSLSNALHARGMYLMIDVVVNHVASETTQVDFSRYIPFDDSSYFHEEAYITNYDDPRQCEDGWLGDEKVPLPDLDTENPTVARTLHAWISALVQKFHIDGLRIDTVKHVNKDFWPGFVRAAGVWCVGEVLSGNPSYLSAYQPFVGGLLDYATYYPLKRAFKTGSASMYELTDTLKPSYRAQWADPQQLATFMENHDMPRFARDTSLDQTVIMNALCWTMLTDGIPIIYYGQENMLTGQSSNHEDDQDSRQLMWSSRFQKGPLYKFIALLNRIRKTAWSTGFGSNLTIPLHTDVATCVVQKGPLILGLSNQGSSAPPNKIQFPTLYPKDTILVDILTGQSLKVKGPISLTFTSGMPQIYLPRAIASSILSPQEILPSPMTPIDKFFSFFRSSSSPTSEIANWSTGAHVNTRDILLPSRVDVSHGRVLGPDPATFASPYSIFQSVSYSAFATTTLAANGNGTTLVTKQDPRGRVSLRTQLAMQPQSPRMPPGQKTSSYASNGVRPQQQRGRGMSGGENPGKQQNTAGWNNYRDVSPAGSFTGQY